MGRDRAEWEHWQNPNPISPQSLPNLCPPIPISSISLPNLPALPALPTLTALPILPILPTLPTILTLSHSSRCAPHPLPNWVWGGIRNYRNLRDREEWAEDWKRLGGVRINMVRVPISSQSSRSSPLFPLFPAAPRPHFQHPTGVGVEYETTETTQSGKRLGRVET